MVNYDYYYSCEFFLYGGLTKLDEQFFCFFFVFYMIESQFWDLMCTTVEQE